MNLTVQPLAHLPTELLIDHDFSILGFVQQPIDILFQNSAMCSLKEIRSLFQLEYKFYALLHDVILYIV